MYQLKSKRSRQLLMRLVLVNNQKPSGDAREKTTTQFINCVHLRGSRREQCMGSAIY